MGVVFQDYRLLTDRNVFMNLHFVLRATGWTQRHGRSAARSPRCSTMVGSPQSTRYKMPLRASRAANSSVWPIARALLNDPQVILLDRADRQPRSRRADGLMQLFRWIVSRGCRAASWLTHNISNIQQISVPHAAVQSGPRRGDRHAVDSWHLAKNRYPCLRLFRAIDRTGRAISLIVAQVCSSLRFNLLKIINHIL
ncbi:MAG: hypothetical protein ACLR8Y_20090 [Alistipes indistinctus]